MQEPGVHTDPATRSAGAGMGLTLKNILVNVIYYGLTVIVLPAVFQLSGTAVGLEPRPRAGLRMVALVATAAGLLLQAWCIVQFQRIGRGTPSPAFPTRCLVTQGPYRWMRNPMNLGELLVFLGLAAWFGSLALLAYAFVASITFHVFIVLSEEPCNTRTFGDPYRAYRRTVNRWLPRPRRPMVLARQEGIR